MKRFKIKILLLTLAFFYTILISGVTLFFILEEQSIPIYQEVELEDIIGKNEMYFETLTKQSPNRRFIAFVTAKNLGMRESKIWVYDKLKKMKYVVAEGKGEFTWVSNPVWSPDSQRIAYFQINPYQIKTVNADGTNNKLLADDPKIYPSIGYAGEVKLIWKDQNTINIENSVEFRKKMVEIKIDSYKITQLAYVSDVAGISSAIENGPPPLISQKDERWKNEQLGSCTHQTIESAGCVITSVAMLMEYYGIKADPQILNQMLSKENIGYANGCDLRWDIVMNYHPGLTLNTVFHYNRSWERLNQELDSGNPVIVGIDNHNHWVLVTHREGDTYFINDPRGVEKGKKTLKDYGNTFDHMVIYHKAS